MEEKQAKMDFTHTYPIERMGVLLRPHKMIHLFELFIREKMGASSLDEFSPEKVITEVGCPFCKKGLLKLTGIEPKYSGGIPPPMPRHVGNFYKYDCSNQKYGGKFFGTYTWMYID